MKARPPAPRRALEGQVLPPLREDLALPPAPLNIPLLARMKYRSEERQLEAYARLVEAKNALLDVLQRQRELLEAREISIVRIENLDKLREIERLKIDNRLTLLLKDAELEGLRKGVEIEELHVRLAEAKRRRAEIESPAPPAEKPTMGKRLATALENLREVDDVFKRQRAELIEAAGGEDNLTNDERQELERLEILRRTQVEKLHEDLL